MAKVQYGAMITALRGSIGGWTFQENRSGNIVRLKPRCTSFKTARSSIAVSEMLQFVAAYTGLTPAQKADWEDFAEINDHQDRFGNVNTLTGQNWFISVNRNRQILGLSVLNSPPTLILPDGNSLFTLDIDATKLELTKSAPISPTDTALKIWATPPLGRSTTSLQSSLRLIKVMDATPFNPIDISPDWVDTFGCSWPPSGVGNRFTIGIMVQLVRISTGISIAGNTQLGALVDPPVGIGFMQIGTDFVVS